MKPKFSNFFKRCVLLCCCVSLLASCKMRETFVDRYIYKTDTLTTYKTMYIHDSTVEVVYVDKITHDTLYREVVKFRDIRDTVFISHNSVSDSVGTTTSNVAEKPSETKKTGRFAKFVHKAAAFAVFGIIAFLLGAFVMVVMRHKYGKN